MALKDKIITLEDLKAVHDVDAEEITGIKADLSAVSFSLSVDSSGNATLIRSDLVNTEEVNY